MTDDHPPPAPGVVPSGTEWDRVSEEHLAAGLRSGQPECLEECFRRWSPAVHTIALRKLADRQDADEVTQEVFVGAWRNRHRLDTSRGSLPGWLIGIAKHRIVDVQRRRAREARRVAAVAVVESAEPHDAGIDRVIDRVLLQSELDELPQQRRDILLALYYEHRTYQEVADRMDLPLGTVKSHARRALQRLLVQLREVTRDPSE